MSRKKYTAAETSRQAPPSPVPGSPSRAGHDSSPGKIHVCLRGPRTPPRTIARPFFCPHMGRRSTLTYCLTPFQVFFFRVLFFRLTRKRPSAPLPSWPKRKSRTPGNAPGVCARPACPRTFDPPRVGPPARPITPPLRTSCPGRSPARMNRGRRVDHNGLVQAPRAAAKTRLVCGGKIGDVCRVCELRGPTTSPFSQRRPFAPLPVAFACKRAARTSPKRSPPFWSLTAQCPPANRRSPPTETPPVGPPRF